MVNPQPSYIILVYGTVVQRLNVSGLIVYVYDQLKI